MAGHMQQQILDAVEALLKTASTAAGSRVFLDRLDPLTKGELPGLVVRESPQGEQLDPQTVHGLEARQFAVVVDCIVADAADYARDSRALGAEVERVLGARGYPVMKSVTARLRSSRITLIPDGDRAMATREQTWVFSYSTQRGVPDVAR